MNSVTDSGADGQRATELELGHIQEEKRTHEMLPHDLARLRGIQTRSSLQIGTISTEYVNL